MQLWTQSENGWTKEDLESLFQGRRLFDLFLAMGMTSARDTSSIEPHRVIVFSPEECRLLGIWGEAFFTVEPAFSQLSSVVTYAISLIGNFSSSQVSDAFSWADICSYDEIDMGHSVRRYVPQVFFLTDGVFSLTPLGEDEKATLVVDISGRFVAELAGEMTGASGADRLN